jgi:hypothetical protein
MPSKEVEGLKELSKQLKKLGLIDSKGLLKAGYTLLKFAKINAPVKTGALRENSEVVQNDDNVEVVFNQNYAYYQEHGNSRGLKGKGFVSKAISEHTQDILDAASSGIQDEIDKNV